SLTFHVHPELLDGLAQVFRWRDRRDLVTRDRGAVLLTNALPGSEAQAHSANFRIAGGSHSCSGAAFRLDSVLSAMGLCPLRFDALPRRCTFPRRIVRHPGS